MLVRINQEGAFEEEIAQDEAMVSPVTELYEEELQRSQKKDDGSGSTGGQNNDEITTDGLFDLEAFQIRESVMNSCVGYQLLLDDLIAGLKEREPQGTAQSLVV